MFVNDCNDIEVEEEERFSLFLISQSPRVSPDPDTATVYIRDDSERELTLHNTIIHNIP